MQTLAPQTVPMQGPTLNNQMFLHQPAAAPGFSQSSMGMFARPAQLPGIHAMPCSSGPSMAWAQPAHNPTPPRSSAQTSACGSQPIKRTKYRKEHKSLAVTAVLEWRHDHPTTRSIDWNEVASIFNQRCGGATQLPVCHPPIMACTTSSVLLRRNMDPLVPPTSGLISHCRIYSLLRSMPPSPRMTSTFSGRSTV